MTAPLPAHLFRNRHRLSAAELSWAARRLAMVDGHHVARVHGRYGVVDGFELTVEPGPHGALVVTPGRAWTPCGDLVVAGCTTRIPPPDAPGPHAILLDQDGGVRTRRTDECEPSDTMRLGAVRAVVRAPYGSDRIRWSGSSVTTEGRIVAVAAARAQVASGREQLGLSDLTVNVDARTVARSVDTTNGRFERTPLYFATVGVGAVIGDSAVDGAFGWFLEVCGATATGFTARFHVQRRDHLEQIVLLQRSSPQTVVELTWLGVDPARPDVEPADAPECSVLLRPPPIVLT